MGLRCFLGCRTFSGEVQANWDRLVTLETIHSLSGLNTMIISHRSVGWLCGGPAVVTGALSEAARLSLGRKMSGASAERAGPPLQCGASRFHKSESGRWGASWNHIQKAHTAPLSRLVIKTQGQPNSRHGEMDFTFLVEELQRMWPFLIHHNPHCIVRIPRVSKFK